MIVDLGRLTFKEATDEGDTEELRLKGSLRHVGPFCAGALMLR